MMNSLNPFNIGIIAIIPDQAWDKGVTFIMLAALAAWTYFREKSKEKNDAKHRDDFIELTNQKVDLLKEEKDKLYKQIEDLQLEIKNLRERK